MNNAQHISVGDKVRITHSSWTRIEVTEGHIREINGRFILLRETPHGIERNLITHLEILPREPFKPNDTIHKLAGHLGTGVLWLAGTGIYLVVLVVVFFLSPTWAGLMLLITACAWAEKIAEWERDKRSREIMREELARNERENHLT